MTTNNLPSSSYSIKICSIEGCERKHDSHGVCGMHHKRFLRHGHYDIVRAPNGSFVACSVEGCNAKRNARGYCQNHWYRWRHHGNPLKIGRDIGLADEERFWKYVQKTDDCWLWIGSQNACGYGKTKVNGKWIKAHRYSFFFWLTANILCHVVYIPAMFVIV